MVAHLVQNSCFYEKQSPEVFYKKQVFLEISQNSQENTCAKVSFLLKLQALAQVFSCGFCEISKNTFLIECLRETASVLYSEKNFNIQRDTFILRENFIIFREIFSYSKEVLYSVNFFVFEKIFIFKEIFLLYSEKFIKIRKNFVFQETFIFIENLYAQRKLLYSEKMLIFRENMYNQRKP